MASLYFSDAARAAEPGGTVVLDGQEGRHAVTVARVRAGERLRIGDAHGTVASGTVADVGKDRLILLVADVARDPEPSPRLVLVQALAKGGRDDMAIQAATEIGVDAVVPWAAARSVSRWEGAKVGKGRARWEAIVHEAAKQAIRSRVPSVGSLVTTTQLAGRPAQNPAETMLILDPTAETALAAWTPGAGCDSIALVVGPEGGMERSEIECLTDAGARPVRLGATVLRTSTAGPAALAVLQARLGRW